MMIKMTLWYGIERRCTPTTLSIVSSVTFYLELQNAIYFYYQVNVM